MPCQNSCPFHLIIKSPVCAFFPCFRAAKLYSGIPDFDPYLDSRTGLVEDACYQCNTSVRGRRGYPSSIELKFDDHRLVKEALLTSDDKQIWELTMRDHQGKMG